MTQPDRPPIRGAAKAAGINSCIGVMRRMVPEPSFNGFVERLPPDLATLVTRPTVATGWVPLSQSIPFFELAYRELFGEDEERMFELGRVQLREDLSTLYKFFIRIASPQFVAGRVALLWETYVRDAGTMKVVEEGPRFAVLALDDYPCGTLPFWPYLRGTIQGTLELTGSSGIQVRLIEGGGATTSCRMRASWR